MATFKHNVVFVNNFFSFLAIFVSGQYFEIDVGVSSIFDESDGIARFINNGRFLQNRNKSCEE